MDSRRRTGNRAGTSDVQQTQADITNQNAPIGRQPYGQPVNRVDFFRRMPVGGTAYLKPVGAEASED